MELLWSNMERAAACRLLTSASGNPTISKTLQWNSHGGAWHPLVVEEHGLPNLGPCHFHFHDYHSMLVPGVTCDIQVLPTPKTQSSFSFLVFSLKSLGRREDHPSPRTALPAPGPARREGRRAGGEGGYRWCGSRPKEPPRDAKMGGTSHFSILFPFFPSS